MAHTGVHNQMRAQVSSALYHQAEPALPADGSSSLALVGLAQWGLLGIARKSCMAAVVSTWMTTERAAVVCCCSVLLSVNGHSTDVFIVYLGKQTKRCQGVKGPPLSPCQRQGARRMPRRNNGKPLWSGVEYLNLPCAGLPGCVGCSHRAVGMTMLSLICPAARAAPGTSPLWATFEHVDPGEDHNTLNKEGSWLQERQ